MHSPSLNDLIACLLNWVLSTIIGGCLNTFFVEYYVLVDIIHILFLNSCLVGLLVQTLECKYFNKNTE